ncbi:hypothetical protein ABKN59_005320 [Abortiporus biennis]
MIRTQAIRNFTSSARATPITLRAAAPLAVRRMATIPDPTKPTSDPAFDSASSKSGGGGGSNTMLWVAVAAAGAGAGWYYMNMEPPQDAHAARKSDEERLKQKTQELKDTSRKTAQDAAKEGEQKYEDYKASGKEKLEQARTSTSSAVSNTEGRLEKSYVDVKNAATATYRDAANKTEQAYADARNKAAETAHKVEATTTETWGEWFGSWFGYGKKKADETKREGAAQVAEGARKVEKEAEKRT